MVRTSNTVPAKQQQPSETVEDSIARGGVSTPFPFRLHEMLDWSDAEGKNDILTWMPHGRAFLVHKPKEFVEEILPNFFAMSKFPSFQRQLNLYGFSRFATGQDKGAYYHKLFVRGHKDLCRNMVRQKIKGTKVRRSLTAEEEPNFYSDNFVYPESPDAERPAPRVTAKSTTATKATRTKRKPSTKKRKDSVTTASPAAPPSSLLSIMRMEQPNNTNPSMSTIDYNHHGYHHQSSSYHQQQQIVDQAPHFAAPVLVEPLSEASLISSSSTDSLVQQQQQQEQLALPSSQTYSSLYMDTAAKGGDLLFFEGQPFRYLEPQLAVSSISTPAPAMYSQPTQPRDYRETLHDVISNVIAMEQDQPGQIATL